MDCDALRDDQWDRIKWFVPGGAKGKRGPRTDNRKFLDALLWMAHSGGVIAYMRRGKTDIGQIIHPVTFFFSLCVLDTGYELVA